MKNQVQFSAFTFKSNSVRVITDNNREPWFCANDVCDILGYSNPRDAISKHCKENGVAKRDAIDSMQRKQETTFINEPNLYRLIIKSRKPEAEPFEAWVFEEVLPQIRKTGKYQLQPQQLALPEPEKKFSFEFTEYELEQLVWLWCGHKQMNTLLGDMIKPLETIGSYFTGMVISHHQEYRRQYKNTLPTIQKLITPFKASNRMNWERAKNLIAQ
ncbi:TPA: BRO family protein [Haemophilus influenzae]|uniref:BRO family protein n=1 Tax=Haemophilus influenzae TaxID=727 RepID=UPI001F177E98|nr:BRO family protein [Haemophilus influenzae]